MNVLQNYVWGLSKPQQYEETIIEITTTQPNQTFEWGKVTGAVQYYDWDNDVRTNSKSHTFANAGVYTIKIVGNIKHFRVEIKQNLNSLVTKIIQVADSINNFSWTFFSCTNLTTIPNGLFDKNINVTDFTHCFTLCLNLTTIPSGLFNKNVNAIDFEGCFWSCSNLTTIPNGLFDKNINAIDFKSCFQHCTNLTTIPGGLFDKNVNAVDFKYCFWYCSNLTNRPKPHGLEMWQIAGTNGRPSEIIIGEMFKRCITMPDFASLPSSVK